MTQSKNNSPIFLVGFMGAGKTTVGKELTSKLGYIFIDLDDVITKRTGKSVQQIFSEEGESVFRGLETESIRSLRGATRSVIALGGGAYVSKANRDLLREIGKTVWLDCPLEICLNRISGDQARPLLGDQKKMQELLAQRRDSYALADYTVNSGDMTPEAVAQKIMQLVTVG